VRRVTLTFATCISAIDSNVANEPKDETTSVFVIRQTALGLSRVWRTRCLGSRSPVGLDLHDTTASDILLAFTDPTTPDANLLFRTRMGA
jgi:hypothetical protein